MGQTADVTIRLLGSQLEQTVVVSQVQLTRTGGLDMIEPGRPSHYALMNDQIDDALGVTLPAGIYTLAFAADAGVTILNGQALAGAIPSPIGLTCMVPLPSTAHCLCQKLPA